MAAAEDPVCGMQVDTDTDLKTEHDGETFYFCSRGCLLDFQEDPEKYSTPSTSPICSVLCGVRPSPKPACVVRSPETTERRLGS